MNRFSGIIVQIIVIYAALATPVTAVAQSQTAQPTTARVYGADYRITPDISRGGAEISLIIRQNRRLLRELSMPLRGGAISEVSGDGEISLTNGRVRWLPPADGGRLQWFAKINHLRGRDTYDAYVGVDWALFRADDVIPPTATRTLRGSFSKTRLMFELPASWSAVSQYFKRAGVHDVSNPGRRFDKPTGWIVLGRLGVRNESIAGVRVVVAAPVGHGVRRLDILAMLHWTLPDVLRLLPDFPKRLTIVSAGASMWRGGLSAPKSFYMHAGRPLISENGTSTLLHEVLHIGLSVEAVSGADWIIEGLAEYYGLEILRRSGTISDRRYESARSALRNWGKSATSMCTDASAGAVTAKAVTLLARLSNEIEKLSHGDYDLDDVIEQVVKSKNRISIHVLRDISEKLTGRSSDVLSDKSLNNCEN
jgi:hypothetical protein